MSRTRPRLAMPRWEARARLPNPVMVVSDAIKHSEVQPGDTVAYHEHAYERKVPDGEGGQNCLIAYEDIQAVIT